MTDTSFIAEVDQAIVTYEQVSGHYASRTREMLDRLGHVGALSRLVLSPDLQQGFKALRDRGELQFTFEAIVVRHAHLFGPEAVEAAQWRLNNANSLLK